MKPLRLIAIALLALLPLAGAAKSHPVYHPGQYIAFDVSFPHRDTPIAMGAMLDCRQGMFVLHGYRLEADGSYSIGGRIPKDQARGKYTLREIVIDYGSHQDVLTSPVDFPGYRVRVE